MDDGTRVALRDYARWLRSDRRVIESAQAPDETTYFGWFAARALREGCTVDEIIVEGLAGRRNK